MLYMVTVTINIPPMLAYIPYMDPMDKEMTQKNANEGLQSVQISAFSVKVGMESGVVPLGPMAMAVGP